MYVGTNVLHMQRFAENLQIKKAKNETAHVQYLKDQRKNWKGLLNLLFAFLEVARTLQTAVPSTWVHLHRMWYSDAIAMYTNT